MTRKIGLQTHPLGNWKQFGTHTTLAHVKRRQ